MHTKKMTLKLGLQIMGLLLFWTSLSGQMCTKVIAYGRDYNTYPFKAYYSSTDLATVGDTLQKLLERLGYPVSYVDESKSHFITSWQPVEAESHYFKLFNRRDYGAADGAYFQLYVDLSEEGGQIKTLVSTKVKTIVGKLESSGKVEKSILEALQNALRTPQIELNNVEVKNK